MKLIVFGFLATSIVLSASNVLAAALDGTPHRIKNARVSILLPSIYRELETGNGFGDPKTNVFYSAMESKDSIYVVLGRYLDEKFLEANGAKMVKKEEIAFGTEKAVLTLTSLNIGGTEYRQWMLLAGDNTGSLVATARYPFAADEKLSGETRERLLGLQWDRSLLLPSEIPTAYRITPSGQFALAADRKNAVCYTLEGKMPVKISRDPMFVLTQPQKADTGVIGKKAYAEKHILSFDKLANGTIDETTSITLQGMPGFETVAKGYIAKTSDTLTLYQVMLFRQDKKVITVQGMTPGDKEEKHIETFEEMARSITPVEK
jgi:hypothetical protein